MFMLCVTLKLVIIGSTGRSRGQHMYDLCYARGGPHPWQRPQIHADEKVRLPRAKPNEGDWGPGSRTYSYSPPSLRASFPRLSLLLERGSPFLIPYFCYWGSKAVLLSSSPAQLPCLQATLQPLQTKAARLWKDSNAGNFHDMNIHACSMVVVWRALELRL